MVEGPPKNTQPFPKPYLSTEVSDRLIQQILDAFNREGLTSEQSRQVLARVKHSATLVNWSHGRRHTSYVGLCFRANILPTRFHPLLRFQRCPHSARVLPRLGRSRLVV